MSILEGNKTLTLIGAGTMGEAILRGILRAGKLGPSQVLASDLRADALADLAKRHGIRTTTDNLEAARAATVALVCVKPYQVGAVLNADAMREALSGKVVISIAAGVRLQQLAHWLPASALIRAMPNTPALIGEGMTAVSRGKGTNDAAMALALDLFASVGRSTEIDETQMDVVTALSGSGPAFAFLVLESLADGAVKMGLRRDLAISMAAQMLQGSARMVLQTGTHPAVLKDQVTTPGGCTIAGLSKMEEGRVRYALASAVEEAARVASKLGQG
ncbi:MAG TPA: pyrroline-5-carboxylate reductase [Polyangia bacterium]|nr:pyrroline-5-carboxylate reductase [Polyangia bacterium]